MASDEKFVPLSPEGLEAAEVVRIIDGAVGKLREESETEPVYEVLRDLVARQEVELGVTAAKAVLTTLKRENVDMKDIYTPAEKEDLKLKILLIETSIQMSQIIYRRPEENPAE